MQVKGQKSYVYIRCYTMFIVFVLRSVLHLLSDGGCAILRAWAISTTNAPMASTPSAPQQSFWDLARVG